MANYGLRQLQFGLKKEGTRGTAESAPTKWYPILPTPEIDFKLLHLEDEGLRATRALFTPVAGRKIGVGKFKMICDPQMLGEILSSLMGAVPTSAQQGGTAAYQHSYVIGSGIQPPAYTFFIDYGHSVLKYNRACVKSVTFNGPVDGLVEVEVEFLFEDEASGSIGSPSFPTQRYFAFKDVDFKIAGSSNTDVKSWTLKIDNMAKALMSLALSQKIQDIVTVEPMRVTGSMVIFFTGTTERDKFFANTAVAIRALMEGAVIASTYKYTVDLPVTAAKYKAYPLGYEDNILACKVDFEGYHNGASLILPVLMNTDTSY
jgi:hypothetical protein